MLTSIYDLQRFASTICEYAQAFDGSNISVQFTGGIKRPRTVKNMSTYVIQIPTPNQHMTSEDDAIVRAHITREIAHLSEGRGFYNKLAENNLKVEESPLAAIAMDLEEARVEREDIIRYKGDRRVLSEGDEYTLPKEIEYHKNIPAKSNLSDEDPEAKEKDQQAIDDFHKYMAARIVSLESKGDWNGSALEASSDMLNNSPKLTKDIVKKIHDAGIIEGIQNLRNYEDSYELAKTLYELLYDQSAEEHEEQQKQKAGGGPPDKGEKEKASGGGSDEGEGGEEEGTAAGKGEGENGEGEGGEPEYEKDIGREIEFKGYQPEGKGGSGANLTYPDKEHIGYDPLPWEEFRIWDIHRDKVSHPSMRDTIRHGERGSYGTNAARTNLADHHEANGVPGKGFGNKLRRFLQVKSQARYVGGAKSGRIHKKNAYRIGVPQVGSGEWNRRVFRDKQTTDILDIAVTVLTDFSGSMSGRKLNNAIDSTMLLNSSIARSLHIPTQILAFTEESCSTFIGIVKGFDDRLSDEEIKDNMIKSAAFMSGNADGDAILWAYENTKYRKEKRKMMIVLSDGSPAGCRSGGLNTYTRQVIKAIEEEGIVEIIGLGIMHQGVKSLYSETAIISRPDELEETLLNIVKNHIMR